MTLARLTAVFSLIGFLNVVIIVGILASIAITMFVRQRNQLKDGDVKGGVYFVELARAVSDVDHRDTKPVAGTLSAATLIDDASVSYVEAWPENPWTHLDMVEGTSRGDYVYARAAGSFTIAGLGAGGTPIFSAP